mgnify:CR=1 FL=1
MYSALVGSSPQVHLVSLLDQLVAELGVRDGDESLGTLPGGQTLEADLAVLGGHVVNVRASIGDDGAVVQGGQDARLQVALLVGEGRGTADEALAALGQVSAQDEVELTACTADLLDAGGLGVDLTEEVKVYRVVDGLSLIHI